MERKSLTEVFPWVKVDSSSYRIIDEGEWDKVSKMKCSGHVMTKSLWEQIVEERNY